MILVRDLNVIYLSKQQNIFERFELFANNSILLLFQCVSMQQRGCRSDLSCNKSEVTNKKRNCKYFYWHIYFPQITFVLVSKVVLRRGGKTKRVHLVVHVQHKYTYVCCSIAAGRHGFWWISGCASEINSATHSQ